MTIFFEELGEKGVKKNGRHRYGLGVRGTIKGKKN